MVLYPELPASRSRMIALDVGMLLVLIAAWVLAGALHDAVAELAEPAVTVQEAAGDLAADLSTPIDIPVVGSLLQVPLGALADGSRELQTAAGQQVEGVERLAMAVGIVAMIPAVLLLLAWLRHRLRWANAAGAVARARTAPGALTVLAMRAAVDAPLPAVLATVGREGLDLHDADQLRALAALELARYGLRPTAQLETATAGTPTGGDGRHLTGGGG